MNTWAQVGVECICINDRGWLKPHRDLLLFLMGFGEEAPGPSFMQQLKITAVSVNEMEDSGHEVKLHFAEFPGERYCVCKFRPLEKIEDEEEQTTTAPVDGDLVETH